MSNEFLPTLRGLTWDIGKSPRFNNAIQSAASLAETRVSFAASPLYDFTIHFSLLRETAGFDELRQLGGFFMARGGDFDSWLFIDPSDTVATDELFGIGTGAQTDFQLQRAFGPFRERVANFDSANAVISVDGTPVGTGFTLNAANGAVVFDSAPSSGAQLTWSGTYYFRCRFKEPVQNFNEFMRDLWEARSVEFVGSLGTKLGGPPA